MGVLYEHWDPLIDECFYVGVSWANEDTRPYDLRNRNCDHTKRVEEIRSVGKEPEVRLIECSHLNDEDLGEFERLQIKYWREFIGDRLTNVASGGVGFGIWDEASRQRQSEIQRRPETVAKKSAAAKAQAEARTEEEWAALNSKRLSHYTGDDLKKIALKGVDTRRKNGTLGLPEDKIHVLYEGNRQYLDNRTKEQIETHTSKVWDSRRLNGTDKPKRDEHGRSIPNLIGQETKINNGTDKQTWWNSKTDEERAELGRKMSEGRKRAKAAREAAKLKDI